MHFCAFTFICYSAKIFDLARTFKYIFTSGAFFRSIFKFKCDSNVIMWTLLLEQLNFRIFPPFRLGLLSELRYDLGFKLFLKYELFNYEHLYKVYVEQDLQVPDLFSIALCISFSLLMHVFCHPLTVVISLHFLSFFHQNKRISDSKPDFIFISLSNMSRELCNKILGRFWKLQSSLNETCVGELVRSQFQRHSNWSKIFERR